jgi:hypothetical protein
MSPKQWYCCSPSEVRLNLAGAIIDIQNSTASLLFNTPHHLQAGEDLSHCHWGEQFSGYTAMVVTTQNYLVTSGGFADWPGEGEPATEVECDVPFSSHFRVNPDAQATRDGLPRIDMKALGHQRSSIVFDSSSTTSVTRVSHGDATDCLTMRVIVGKHTLMYCDTMTVIYFCKFSLRKLVNEYQPPFTSCECATWRILDDLPHCSLHL